MIFPPVHPKVHNRFDVFRKRADTGIEEQIAYAENIVLDAMWPRLCGGSTYFVNIHYGTGSGTLEASRTGLFTHLGTAVAADVAKVKALPTSYWRRSIVLGLDTANGSTLTELGIAYSATAGNLVTHALIRDMNGNVISIPKTNLDIITIYATVYITLDNSDANLKLVHPDQNGLIDYLLGGSFPAANFTAGESRLSENWPRGLVSQSLGAGGTGSWSADVANKKRTTSVCQFGTAQGNGDIGEVLASTIARLLLPASGIYAGLDLVGVPVGTGDGANDTFYLPSNNARLATVVIKKDGDEETGVTLTPIEKYLCYANAIGAPMNSAVTACAVSDDGSMLVICYSSAPYVATFRYENEAWVINQVPPSVIGSTATGCALSEDGLVLAVCQNGTGYIRSYDWVNGLWVLRPQPPNAPNAQPNGIDLSADGSVMAVAFNASPYIRAYDWVAGAWVMRAQLTSPSNFPTGISLSGDGLVMAFSHTVSPYIATYDWSESAWVARSAPASPPSTTGVDCALSKNGDVLAVALDASTWSKVYDWSESAWVVRTQPSQLNARTRSISLSQDGTRLVATLAASPYFVALDWIAGAWVQLPTFSLANGDGEECDITADKSLIVFTATNAGPYFRAYYADDIRTKVVFATPPANGAVITADYTVDGIHKTTQRVIDCQFTIQFGEPT